MKIWTLLCLFTLIMFFSCEKEIDPGVEIPEPEPQEVDDLISALTYTLNPSGNLPLSAMVTLQAAQAVEAEYEVLGKYAVFMAINTLATEHELPVFGLYADSTNKIAIKAIDEKGNFQFDTLLIATEPLPEILPIIEIVQAPAQATDKNFTFSMYEVGTLNGWFSMPIIFDNDGNIRWYMSLDELDNLASPGEFLKNGNFILGEGAFIYEYDLMGNEVNKYVLSGYAQHHDIFEKKDGNLLLAVTKNGLDTYNDHIIELDTESGNIIREWDLRQSLDQDRNVLSSSTSDWIHVNSVWHDHERDNIVVSARTQGVACLSMENELHWILSPHKEWGLSGSEVDCNEFLLQAVDESGNAYPEEIQIGDMSSNDFNWSFGQHAAEILDNGNLIVFDNGDKRNFNNSIKYSRGVEYEIDRTNKIVRQVWEYGKERSGEIFSRYKSDIDILPENGHRVICPAKIEHGNSYAARVIEVKYPSNEVVFEAFIPFPIFSDKRGTGVYRSERINLPTSP